ncbi:hypothetical protein FSP39_024431 [Pinctada imbricata]|uniref:Tyrosinase copper-binding domain-containing protein n=1 Tax=Pinctada imbricata TaxID=66713 RepID=A0AA88XQR2_PINIB|nr:hypothetical protein FSP39_024431 [Pinctada imbricata]
MIISAVAILISYFGAGLAFIEEIPLPSDYEQCLDTQYRRTDLTRSVGYHVYWRCKQKSAMRYAMESGTNMTYEEYRYMISLLPPRNLFFSSGFKDFHHPNAEPRIRKEYRRMTESERNAYHHAINLLKRIPLGKSNRYDVLAAIHQGGAIGVAHEGPNFLGWHRVYLLIYENALRQVVPGVTVPYFAGELDGRMRDSKKSVLFSEKFLGTGRGAVRTGPFRNFKTESGPLVRNIAEDGQLWTDEGLERILNQSSVADITTPNAADENSIERQHDDIHGWLGGGVGQIGELEESSQDPVFFNLHAYVDFIFERFRDRLLLRGKDPADDYPKNFGDERHSPTARMGFGNILNYEGYSNGLASVVHYEPVPTCSKAKPYCGSKYLVCNTRANPCRCESRTTAQVRRMQSRNKDDFDDEDTCETNEAMQNRYRCDQSNDIRKFVFVPVEVISRRPPEKSTYNSYPVFNSKVYTKLGDIYSPKTYGIDDMLPTGKCATYTRCENEYTPSAGKIFVEANGLNYQGQYTDFAVIDTRLALSSSTSYVAVKSPEIGKTEVLLSARDVCGRMCKAYCRHFTPTGTEYRLCNGAIRVTSQAPKLYGRNYGENVIDLWKLPLGGSCPTFQREQVAVKFFCDFKSDWLWGTSQNPYNGRSNLRDQLIMTDNNLVSDPFGMRINHHVLQAIGK